jgi:hypothetical protein
MLDDDALVIALADLGRSLVTPSPVGLAVAVRARLDEAPPTRSWLDRLRLPPGGPGRRSVRLALVLALVTLALAAAAVGAGLIGLPGLRFLFEPNAVPTSSAPVRPVSPAPSARLGSSLGLGDGVALADLDRRVGFHVVMPDDPVLGPPDAVYVDPSVGKGHVTLVWAAGDGLPPISAGSDIGLIVTQFRGTLDPGYFSKLIRAGTILRSVEVGDVAGYWIEGELHFFFYVDPDGRSVDETRRLVGDVLAFERDGLTVRIETATGLDRAVEIAGSLR